MSEFVAYIRDILAPFGAIQSRRMFGGYGLYHQGVMFALVADDTLYLKADAASAQTFTARDLPPFEYPRRGRMVQLSYYLAPEEIFEDPEAALSWARHAFEAALRARKDAQ